VPRKKKTGILASNAVENNDSNVFHENSEVIKAGGISTIYDPFWIHIVLAITFRIRDTISYPDIGSLCLGIVLIEYYFFLGGLFYTSSVQAEPGLSSFR